MKLPQRLYKFLRLRLPAKIQLIEACMLPCTIWIGFRILGVARTQGLLRQWTDPGRGRIALNGQPERIISSARGSQRAIRNVLRIEGTCLVRSFTLWAMLRRRGIETEVRVGMRKREGQIEGHAWLEYEGCAVNESPAVVETYSVLPEAAAFDLWRKARS